MMDSEICLAPPYLLGLVDAVEKWTTALSGTRKASSHWYRTELDPKKLNRILCEVYGWTYMPSDDYHCPFARKTL